MKLLKKILASSFFPILAVVVLGLLAGKGLFGPGYFNMHDDLQLMRQLEMEKCFLDLQIPCRWVQDMGYGYGFPLFNFYPPLPYLVGEIVRVFGVSFVDTAKILFVFAFAASGVTMYFLGKEFFGKLGGVVASVFYVWAPYHAVDVYVRGAMNESWALIFFPLILWTSYRLITNKDKLFPWAIGLTLSFLGLLTSHNLMVMIFTPVFAVWCLIWIIKYSAWNRLPKLIVSGIFALGLAAFFTLPVLIEQKLVQADTLTRDYYEFVAHFASVNQLFVTRFWGYGSSIWAYGDGMSFQVGHVHWILSIIVGVTIAYQFIRRKKVPRALMITMYLLLVSWFATFMIHNKSTPIWQLIPPLAYVQFPWRFLSLVILGLSFAAGSVVLLLPKKIAAAAGVVLIAGLIAFNWNYFLPKDGKLGALTDKEKFSGAAWELQQGAGILDYLPDYAVTAPKEPQQKEGLTEVMRGNAKVENPYQKSNFAGFDVDVVDETAQVRVGILKFEGWRAYVDGVEISTFVPKEEVWGRTWIEVPKGKHAITFKFTNTPIRTIGNTISLISWIALPVIIICRKKLSFLS